MSENLISLIIMEEEYQNPDAFRGIEMYDHLWLLWEFDKMGPDSFSPTVRPPRLGGNTRLGVFATRSPHRPNPIGLTAVKLVSIDKSTKNGPVLTVAGADMRSGTAILDIKPYLPYADSHPDARCDLDRENLKATLKVRLPGHLPADLTGQALEALKETLSLDPRPSYQHDENRIYGMSYGKYQVHFKVSAKGILTVTDIV